MQQTIGRGSGMPTAAHLLLIILLTAGVYAVSLGNGFVLDDQLIIVKNPQTLSLQSVPEVLLSPDIIKPYYRPLNRATYILDYQLFGMNPAWYHAVNILVHLGSVLLLYTLCRRLFEDSGTALAVALIFAVHPANSEAVNFVSARNTLLAAFFSLASMLALLHSREKGKRWPLLAGFLFFCGLLCKETAFMLIGVVGLLLVTPVLPQTGFSRLPAREKAALFVPFLSATVIYFFLRAYSLHGLIAAQPSEQGLIARLSQNLTLIPQYLGLLIFPRDLTIYHVVNPKTGFFAFPGVIIAIWLAILTGVYLLVRSGNRAALFGLAWCVINYVPVSNIIPIPATPVAERFVYLSAIGFFIAIGSFLSGLSSGRKWRTLFLPVGATVIIALAVLTVQRNLDWKNELTLFTSGVENNPTSATAHYNLGTALRDQGDLTAAVREWQRTLQLDPTNSDALIQIGTFTAIQGDLKKAEQLYLAALRAPQGIADPDKSMAHYNLGKIYEKQGLLQKALEQYEMFLRLVPVQYEEYRPDAEQRLARLRRKD